MRSITEIVLEVGPNHPATIHRSILAKFKKSLKSKSSSVSELDNMLFKLEQVVRSAPSADKRKIQSLIASIKREKIKREK